MVNKNVLTRVSGILKIVTAVTGLLTLGLTGDSYSKPYPDPSNRQRSDIHVIQDEFVFSIVVIFCILSIVWLIILFLDVIHKLNLIRWTDIGFHAVGGLFLLAAGIWWSVTVSERSVNLSSSEVMERSQMAMGKFGPDNIVYYNYDKSSAAARLENGKGKFAELIIDAVLILINAILYVAISAWVYFKENQLNFNIRINL